MVTRLKLLAAALLLCPAIVWATAFTFTDQAWMGQVNAPVATGGGVSAAGLVGYWSFDSNTVSGASVADLSGNTNTATLQGSPLATIVAGHRGEAVRLDNSSTEHQFVSAADSASLNISGAVTLSAWVKYFTYPTGGYPNVVGKATDYRGYMIFFHADGYVQAQYGSTAAGFTGTPADSTFGANTWRHFATVNEGVGGYIRFYRNGVELLSGTFMNANTLTAVADVIMGRHYGSGAYGYLNGAIDEVRIYNRALSPAEIAALAAE